MLVENRLHPIRDFGQRTSFSLTLAIAIGATVVAAILLAFVGIYSATHESDAVSVERQARSARHAMDISVHQLARQQETVATWNDSITRTVADQRDKRWLNDNIGSWLHRVFGHDNVFILDGQNRPIYAAVEGEQVSLDQYAMLAPDFELLVNGVRGAKDAGNGRRDRTAARMLASNGPVRTSSRTTHDSRMMLIGGRPAAASATLIQPSTPTVAERKGDWPILLSVRYFDTDFLGELSASQLISSPRFSRSPGRFEGEHLIRLQTDWGKTIGYLIWKPELPGIRILWKLVPLNLLGLFAFALLVGFLGRRLRNSNGDLAAAGAQAVYLAFHDSLTGLPNRALFQRRLEDLTSGEQAARHFALLLLDVDEFKLTNDMLGHDAGDAVLLAFATQLRLAIRSDDLVARLGGDEFALLLMGKFAPAELEAFSTTLLERLREPVEHHGNVIHSHASIGASTGVGVDSGHNLLKHADLALYEAKDSGRGAYRLYHPAMWSGMLLRREMLSVAAAALEGDFITPFYQPKVNLQTGEIVGFEALLRCCLPGQEPKGPECLAAAFEDSALAVGISDRMVDGVVRDISAWRAAGVPFGHVAINAALAELRCSDFAERLLVKLESAGIPPECIQIEVTESVLLGRAIDQVERTFDQLAKIGIRLALDDFGTGFASLTHLKRFPIAIIKIDQSFVRDLQVDEENDAIVDALIGLGRALKIDVIAEGIETWAQHDFLAALGCGVGQGFLFGSAVPAARIADFLHGTCKRQIAPPLRLPSIAVKKG